MGTLCSKRNSRNCYLLKMTWSVRECDCCNSSAVRSPLLMENVSSRHHTQDELVKYEFDLLRTYCPHCRHKRNPLRPIGDGGWAGPGYLPQIAQIEDTAHFLIKCHHGPRLFGLHPSGLFTFGLSPFGLQSHLDNTQYLWHLDYRRLDYKDVWTIPIGLLVHLDYQNLDYIPSRLHGYLDYILSDYFGLCKFLHKSWSNIFRISTKHQLQNINQTSAFRQNLN